MIRIAILTMICFSFFMLEAFGQSHPEEYWKTIADDAEAIVVGTVEEYRRVIRPEKFGLNPDGSSPSESEIYVGIVFRVKVTETLKGKIKSEKVGKNNYTNVFLYWVTGIPAMGDPVLLKGKEYVLFLRSNNDEDLEGKETIEFKPEGGRVQKPFNFKSSFVVVHGFRGAFEIKPEADKKALILEIRDAI